MEETWQLQDSHSTTGDALEALVRDRLDRGERETWLESTSGRMAGLVTNGTRAMLVLMEYEGDAGFHAGDRNAGDETSSGYVLSNGQVDSYPDRDTVSLGDALRALAELVRTGELDARIHWVTDR